MSSNKPPKWAVRTKADHKALEAGYYWDQSRADHIIKFAHRLFKPQYIAGEFKLLPWQARFLQSLVAWRKPDGSRRWKTANLHISKKNGKTLLVSVLCLYELLTGHAAFVASGSVTKENAGQVFSELRSSVRGISEVKVIPNQRKMSLDQGDYLSEYRASSSDGDSAQGYNLSLAVVDEAHAHKSNSLYDSLRYATIARPDGLLIVISTAGDDVTH